MDLFVLFLTVVVCAVLSFFILKPKQEEVAAKAAEREKEKEPTPEGASPVVQKQLKKEKVAAPAKTKHPWERGSLKGHQGEVLCIDINKAKTHCLTCSSDSTVRVWTYEGIEDKSNRHVRANIEFDSPTVASFSGDGMYVLAATADSKAIKIYKFAKDKTTKAYTLTPARDFASGHSHPIHSLQLAPNNKYMMAASIDTTLSVFGIKGEKLATVDTGLMLGYSACVSPDSRFIMCTGFVGEAKIYEVEYSKTGEFVKVAKAYQLKGHTGGIYSGCFSEDGKLAATVSKDGTWKLWDIDIRYQAGQDAACLVTAKYTAIKDPLQDEVHQHTHIKLSPDNTTVVVAVGTGLYFFAAKNGTLVQSIPSAHAGTITGLAFDAGSEVALSSSRDRSVRVWTNVAGMKVKVDELARRLKGETSDLVKERLKQTIKDLKAQVQAIEASS